MLRRDRSPADVIRADFHKTTDHGTTLRNAEMLKIEKRKRDQGAEAVRTR